MKRSLALCLVASLMILLVKTPIALADNGSQLRNHINQIEKKRQTTLNDLQNKANALNTNKQKQANIGSQVQKLESEIVNLNYKTQVKQNSIQTTQVNIQTLKNNMTMLQKRIKERKSIIAKRARVAYVNGGSVSYIQLLLDANNFYEFVNRVLFINKIAQQDHAILKQQVSDKQNLENDQFVLQKTLNQLTSDLKSLKQMKTSLAGKKEKEQTLLAQLKEDATHIQFALASGQKKATFFKQQEDFDRQKLLVWEKQQGIKYGSGIPQECHIFIAPAQELQNTSGIPAAITLAQIILESDAGGHLSKLASVGNNLFGIKGEGPAGTIYLKTHEVIGGDEITIEAGFKRYDSYYQSMVDHAKILNNPRYQYFLKNAQSLSEYAHGIKDGGYSTDPEYAAKLLDVIQAYGLAQYDTGSF